MPPASVLTHAGEARFSPRRARARRSRGWVRRSRLALARPGGGAPRGDPLARLDRARQSLGRAARSRRAAPTRRQALLHVGPPPAQEPRPRVAPRRHRLSGAPRSPRRPFLRPRPPRGPAARRRRPEPPTRWVLRPSPRLAPERPRRRSLLSASRPARASTQGGGADRPPAGAGPGRALRRRGGRARLRRAGDGAHGSRAGRAGPRRPRQPHARPDPRTMTRMRRLATGLVVAAVLGVGAAAVVDALPEDNGRQPVPAGRPSSPRLAERLRDLGVRGVITYRDRKCSLHAIRLPSLRPARAPSIESCEPHVPTGGIGTWKGDVVWSGFGYQTVQVVLSQEEIGHVLRGRFGLSARDVSARQAVGLEGGAVAVLAESDDGRLRVLAGFSGGRLRFLHPGGELLRPSPRGGDVAVVDPAKGGVTVYTRTGAITPLPDLGEAHSIA